MTSLDTSEVNVFIDRVTNAGELYLSFSEHMLFPENLQEILENDPESYIILQKVAGDYMPAYVPVIPPPKDD